MALSFPLSWSDFGKLLPIESAPFMLKRFETVTRSGSGKALTSELTDPLWTVAVTLDVMTLAEASPIQALIELHGTSRRFFLHDPAHMGPADDSDGSALGSATPTVLAASSPSIRIQGLPSGYVLRLGDRLTIGYPGGRGLHRVVEPRTAGSDGRTDWLQVDPPPRPSAAAGLSVGLAPPLALMTIDPGSFKPGTIARSAVRGMAFSATEAP